MKGCHNVEKSLKIFPRINSARKVKNSDESPLNHVNSNGSQFKPSPNSKDSFQSSMIVVLLIGRVLSLMPVQGFTENNAASVKFRWCTVGVFYSFLIMASSLAMAGFTVLKIYKQGFDFEDSSIFFTTMVFSCNLLFLQLATKWPQLCLQWQEVETSMHNRYGYPINITLKFRIITFILLVASLIEHSLSYLQRGVEAARCSDGTLEDWLRFASYAYYPQIFKYVNYSRWILALVMVLYLIFAMIWNYMDLFVILMSLALNSRFKLLSQNVKQIRGRVMALEFWRDLREDYNSLALLCKCVDSCISKIILLSFASNLYFICLQLFNSLHPLREAAEITYFYYSFVYLVLRSVSVSLCAASVHEESKSAKSVLYSVPSSSYNVEIERMIQQVSSSDVALTGIGLFSVTKNFFLTVVGTIITYEIFLVQFSNLNGYVSESSNYTCNVAYKNSR